jgi:5-methylcytosine-specific restriction endonuclease McrA
VKAAHPWCVYCGSTVDLTVDHIVAVVDGGSSEKENLLVACRTCNSRRGRGGIRRETTP